MSTSEIRAILHNYLELADEKNIEAIYTVMQGNIEDTMGDYSDGLKQELDARHKEYQQGNATVLSAEESKQRIDNLLRSKK